MKFLHTPGHTTDSMCILVDDKALLTGDTLFIGNCGRTDLVGGSDSDMYASLQRLKSMGRDILIYPGHHYGEKPWDTLENQMKNNLALRARTFQEFLELP